MKSLNLGLLLLTFLASLSVFAETKTIQIKGMTCGGCVATIKAAVCDNMKSSLKKCNVEIGSITVEADKVDVVAINGLIQNAGYTPTDEKGAAAPPPPTTPVNIHQHHDHEHMEAAPTTAPTKPVKKK